VPFSLTRTYTSIDTTVGRLGPGWADSFSASLAIQTNGDALLHGEDGQEVLYTKQTDGSFVGAAGATSTLSSSAGGYALTRHDQVVYSFNSAGVLQSELDRNGKGLTFAYNGSGQLSTVTDAAGRAATLAYNGSGLLASVTTSDGRTVSYGYTGGNLTSVTLPDPDGAGPLAAPVTTFTYDGGGRLASEVDPDNHTVFSNIYDP
jgi:YD repeat-containing protein